MRIPDTFTPFPLQRRWPPSGHRGSGRAAPGYDVRPHPGRSARDPRDPATPRAELLVDHDGERPAVVPHPDVARGRVATAATGVGGPISRRPSGEAATGQRSNPSLPLVKRQFPPGPPPLPAYPAADDAAGESPARPAIRKPVGPADTSTLVWSRKSIDHVRAPFSPTGPRRPRKSRALGHFPDKGRLAVVAGAKARARCHG